MILLREAFPCILSTYSAMKKSSPSPSGRSTTVVVMDPPETLLKRLRLKPPSNKGPPRSPLDPDWEAAAMKSIQHKMAQLTRESEEKYAKLKAAGNFLNVAYEATKSAKRVDMDELDRTLLRMKEANSKFYELYMQHVVNDDESKNKFSMTELAKEPRTDVEQALHESISTHMANVMIGQLRLTQIIKGQPKSSYARWVSTTGAKPPPNQHYTPSSFLVKVLYWKIVQNSIQSEEWIKDANERFAGRPPMGATPEDDSEEEEEELSQADFIGVKGDGTDDSKPKKKKKNRNQREKSRRPPVQPEEVASIEDYEKWRHANRDKLIPFVRALARTADPIPSMKEVFDNHVRPMILDLCDQIESETPITNGDLIRAALGGEEEHTMFQQPMTSSEQFFRQLFVGVPETQRRKFSDPPPPKGDEESKPSKGRITCCGASFMGLISMCLGFTVGVGFYLGLDLLTAKAIDNMVYYKYKPIYDKLAEQDKIRERLKVVGEQVDTISKKMTDSLKQLEEVAVKNRDNLDPCMQARSALQQDYALINSEPEGSSKITDIYKKWASLSTEVSKGGNYILAMEANFEKCRKVWTDLRVKYITRDLPVGKLSSNQLNDYHRQSNDKFNQIFGLGQSASFDEIKRQYFTSNDPKEKERAGEYIIDHVRTTLATSFTNMEIYNELFPKDKVKMMKALEDLKIQVAALKLIPAQIQKETQNLAETTETIKKHLDGVKEWVTNQLTEGNKYDFLARAATVKLLTASGIEDSDDNKRSVKLLINSLLGEHLTKLDQRSTTASWLTAARSNMFSASGGFGAAGVVSAGMSSLIAINTFMNGTVNDMVSLGLSLLTTFNYVGKAGLNVIRSAKKTEVENIAAIADAGKKSFEALVNLPDRLKRSPAYQAAQVNYVNNRSKLIVAVIRYMFSKSKSLREEISTIGNAGVLKKESIAAYYEEIKFDQMEKYFNSTVTPEMKSKIELTDTLDKFIKLRPGYTPAELMTALAGVFKSLKPAGSNYKVSDETFVSDVIKASFAEADPYKTWVKTLVTDTHSSKQKLEDAYENIRAQVNSDFQFIESVLDEWVRQQVISRHGIDPNTGAPMAPLEDLSEQVAENERETKSWVKSLLSGVSAESMLNFGLNANLTIRLALTTVNIGYGVYSLSTDTTGFTASLLNQLLSSWKYIAAGAVTCTAAYYLTDRAIRYAAYRLMGPGEKPVFNPDENKTEQYRKDKATWEAQEKYARQVTGWVSFWNREQGWFPNLVRTMYQMPSYLYMGSIFLTALFPTDGGIRWSLTTGMIRSYHTMNECLLILQHRAAEDAGFAVARMRSSSGNPNENMPGPAVAVDPASTKSFLFWPLIDAKTDSHFNSIQDTINRNTAELSELESKLAAGNDLYSGNEGTFDSTKRADTQHDYDNYLTWKMFQFNSKT